MNSLIVYESEYGNTRAIAEAVAEGLEGASVLAAHEAPTHLAGIELVVVGGPSHSQGLSTLRNRLSAAAEIRQDDVSAIEAAIREGQDVRRWLREIPTCRRCQAASFETRLDRSPLLSGVISRTIAKRLRRRGYTILSSESFLADDREGPLAAGELERARVWGAALLAGAHVGAELRHQPLAQPPAVSGSSAR